MSTRLLHGESSGKFSTMWRSRPLSVLSLHLGGSACEGAEEERPALQHPSAVPPPEHLEGVRPWLPRHHARCGTGSLNPAAQRRPATEGGPVLRRTRLRGQEKESSARKAGLTAKRQGSLPDSVHLSSVSPLTGGAPSPTFFSGFRVKELRQRGCPERRDHLRRDR